MTGLPYRIWLFIVLTLVVGCQAKMYTYTNPAHHVSVAYPGNLSLVSEKETLEQVVGESQSDTVDRPELLFVVATPSKSNLSCSVHQLPEGSKMTADEYYQASTANEIVQLGATVVDKKSEITLNERVFQRVGFTVQVDEVTTLYVRIYQHLDSKSGRILVLTVMVDQAVKDHELALLEPVVSSLKLEW